MRVITVLVLAVTVAVAMLVRRGDSASVRRPLEDDEEYRPRLYREYGLVRSRSARADDSFDDYGHLRFGRSDD